MYNIPKKKITNRFKLLQSVKKAKFFYKKTHRNKIKDNMYLGIAHKEIENFVDRQTICSLVRVGILFYLRSVSVRIRA